MTINERLNEIQSRLNNVEVRLNNMDARLNNLDLHLNNIVNHITVVNPQLKQQLDRIEQGGRRNLYWGGSAFSAAVMIYAGGLLISNPLNIWGIILLILGLVLASWCALNLIRNV